MGSAAEAFRGSSELLESGFPDRHRLPDFKRPRTYYFVDELPKNPSGKIQKFELRENEGDVDLEAERVAS